MENGFKSFKEGFESLENILAIGKWIRIAQRGIRIAKAFYHFWKTFREKGFESPNLEIHECTRKCKKMLINYTNSLIILTYHTEKFNNHESSNIIHINHAKFSSNFAKLIFIQWFGENISKLVESINIFNAYVTFKCMISNEMMPNLNVLGAWELNRILGDIDGICFVTKDRNIMQCNTKITQLLFNP